YKYEKNEKDNRFASIINDDFRMKLISSAIGEDASKHLDIWLKFYRKYDSLIDEVFQDGDPKPPEEVDAQIVVAIAIANKFAHFARENTNTNLVQKKAAHMLGWIDRNSTADAKICAFRSCFDYETFSKHGLHNFPETEKLWND